MKLKPLHDSVVFQFLDDIKDGAFISKTKSGIILTNKDSDANANNPRWGRVVGVGPEVKEIGEGDFILVAPLRWTLSFKFENNQYCKTIEKEILLVATEVEEINQLYS